MDSPDLEYVGFWLRVWAALIDSLLVCVLILPVLTVVYGNAYWSSPSFVQGPVDFLLSWVLPAVAVVLFWVLKKATPGTMAVSAQVVDAKTGGKASTSQLVVRYLGYFVAMIPFFIGIIWVAFDPRKQGWHDKLAGTVVVRKKSGGTQPVSFSGG
jgi:uncharacterized RDD family membrane protein YckC